MEKNTSINTLSVDLQYFGNVYWFKKAIKYKHIEFSEYEYHSKMSFRNRLWLAGADGRMNLSVPILDGRNERQLYKEVKIAGGRWATDHFRAICSCYNRSPWFEHYRDDLAELYKKQYQFLQDWNLACLDWVNDQLGQPIDWQFISPVGSHPSGATRRVRPDGNDYTNFYRPGNMDEWIEEGGGGIKYAQVFEERTGFIPGLSILDLLFCEGPAAIGILQNE
ncbi:WbqC family protein [Flavihumibacter stibioxidans]|uniref:WbqC-like protein n=1 Tax=Flavihumibacter stibioxidans TaxID=1834163 RepID=A0ABR7M5L8_9BACT|nr:WbqC family protein [Flavihumibacter stibioxidans]MBC6489908.1 hypothetical protein [Flavihumibacter stibioxidans]